VAASNAQANTEAPSVYSCHLKQTLTSGSGQASFLVPGLNSNSTLNTGSNSLNLSTCYLRMYVYLATITGTAGNGSQLTPLALFQNDGGNSPINEVFLFINSSGKLVLQDVGGTYHTGTTVLSLNTWYRIDLFLNTSTGAWAARINDTSELSGTTSGAATVYTIQIGGQNSTTFEYYVDDIWVDSSAYAPDGGCSIFTANGNGNYTAWSGTASGAVPPSSSGALTDSTNGDIRTVAISPNISSGGTVNAVKSMAYVKAASATTSLAVHLRSGTTDSDSSGATSLSTSGYTLLEKDYLTDPNTSSAWTVSGVNAAQPGVKNITNGGGTSDCEAIYLMADFVGTAGPGSVLLIPPFTFRRRFEPAYFE
jgi:hypothetical protein